MLRSRLFRLLRATATLGLVGLQLFDLRLRTTSARGGRLFLLESLVSLAASATPARGFFGFTRLGLFLLAGRCRLGALVRGLNLFAFFRVIDQLDNRQFCVIAVAPPQLDDARITARTILVAFAQLIKETLQCSNARRARSAHLCAPSS